MSSQKDFIEPHTCKELGHQEFVLLLCEILPPWTFLYITVQRKPTKMVEQGALSLRSLPALEFFDSGSRSLGLDHQTSVFCVGWISVRLDICFNFLSFNLVSTRKDDFSCKLIESLSEASLSIKEFIGLPF